MGLETALQRRALIIANPRVYSAATVLKDACELLQQRGITTADIWPVNMLDQKPPMVALWQTRGINLVIAAGGDGSIGAATTHLAGSGMPLGILPLGTSNDFARSLRLPLSLEAACDVIASGHILAVDIGCAQPALTAPYALHEAAAHHHLSRPIDGEQPARAFFTHTLTLGLNVTFARLATSATMRQRFGPFTYPVAALSTLSNAQPMEFTLTFHGPACALAPEEAEHEIEPDRPYHYQALQVAVINSPVFGGPMEFALAGVELHDHLLDMLIVENFDLRQLLAAAQIALTPTKDGRRAAVSSRFPGIHHVKAREVIIETAEPADVTLDGELRGRTPILVSSVARALHVLVPKPAAEAEDQTTPVAKRSDEST